MVRCKGLTRVVSVVSVEWRDQEGESEGQEREEEALPSEGRSE